jgi:hypothetical protein
MDMSRLRGENWRGNLPNRNIKDYAKEKGVKMWQIAQKMSITQSYLCVLLRENLTEDQIEAYKELIDEIADGATEEKAKGA